MPHTESFSTGNHWLSDFGIRHITFCTLCGEARAEDEDVCSKWKSTLVFTIADYSHRNIFNTDENGLFFKCLPYKRMTLQGKTC